jgi:hypothetical protein
MFRKGDEAFIRATAELITIQGPLSAAEEKLLHRAHPTVLNSIKAGPDASARSFEDSKKEWPAPKALPEGEVTARATLYSKLQDWASPLKFNGHYYKAPPRRVRDFLFLRGLLNEIAFDDVEQLLKAIEQGKALRKWVRIGTTEVFHQACCPHCGQLEFTVECNGKDLRVGGEPCPYPKGFPHIDLELNIPSGKLVFGDDRRDFDELFPFPLPHAEDDFVSQQRHKVLQAEKKGLVSFRFGQVSPRLYQLDKDSFKLINWLENERWDGKAWVPVKTPKIEGEEVTGTEYGFSACDGDVFKRFVKHLKPEDLPETITLDVTPGVYQFRIFTNQLYASNPRKEIRYAEIKYLRAPDEPRDYLAEYLALEPTPEQVVRSEVAQWPTLYGVRGKTWETMTEVERSDSWRKVADHLFFVIGGGTDWHKKGFPLISVAGIPPDPTFSIPKFREQLHWYPFSEGYSVLSKKTNFTPEFATLAFEALESVISFGVEPCDDRLSGRDVQRCREMMVRALKWYRKLAKRYPTSANPDFLAWVSEKGRADAWVKMFDLGPEFTEKHHANFLAQKHLPDGVQYLEFDAHKLKDGHFAWKKGYWAKKEDAECYALPTAEGTSGGWFSTATKHIPLYAVAKVLETGVRDHCGKRLVVVSFEYGSEWMQDSSIRKGFFEHEERVALRSLTKEEYEELLPKAKKCGW